MVLDDFLHSTDCLPGALLNPRGDMGRTMMRCVVVLSFDSRLLTLYWKLVHNSAYRLTFSCHWHVRWIKLEEMTGGQETPWGRYYEVIFYFHIDWCFVSSWVGTRRWLLALTIEVENAQNRSKWRGCHILSTPLQNKNQRHFQEFTEVAQHGLTKTVSLLFFVPFEPISAQFYPNIVASASYKFLKQYEIHKYAGIADAESVSMMILHRSFLQITGFVRSTPCYPFFSTVQSKWLRR